MSCLRRAALALLLTSLGLAGAAACPPFSTSAQDPTHWSAGVRRVVLPNGLTLLLFVRGEAPIVSVQALYKVGSRNDPPGMSGVAHYVEHMAFRSTEHIAKADLTNQIVRWGGRWNGYTSYDQTTYASAVPSQHLEWAMVLERERMARVLFAEDEVARERTSVISELRQYENWPPYTLIDNRLRPTAFVAHPYGAPIMGWIDDLESMTGREIQDFYRRYYAPNNLVLAVVGRFDSDQALALAQKHFGDAAGTGQSPAIRTVEPAQFGEKRVTLRGPGRVSHVEIAVHAPALADPDFATLLVVDALLSSGRAPGRAAAGKGTVLERMLVARGLATRVSTETEAGEYPGLYSIGVEAPDDYDFYGIEAAVAAAIRTLERATDDAVSNAADQVRAALMLEGDSNSAIADMLARFEGLGSYQRLASLDRELASVTPRAVATFAAARLSESRWNVGWFVPESDATPRERRRGPATAPPSSTTARSDREGRLVPPEADLSVPSLPVPAIERLPNGLTALALDVAGDVASLRVRIEAGAAADPPDRPGLAVMAGRLLGAATGASGPEESPPLEMALGALNATLSESAFSLDASGQNRRFLEIAVRVPHARLEAAIDLVAERLAHPRLSPANVDEARRALHAELEAAEDDSDWRAVHAALATLYPPSHPYGRAPEGTANGLDHISLDDVRGFYERWIRPDRTLVAVAGASEPQRALATIRRAFGRWQPDGTAAAPVAPPVTGPTGHGSVHVNLPHKAQASVVVALPGPARADRDRAALAALNYLLGETGYAGRLGETLVDTGIAYSVYSTMSDDREGGPILIQTNAVNADEAVRRIKATLETLARGGATDKDRREAQGYLLGGLLFRFESAASATSALADLAHAGAAAEWTAFAERVRALTTADMNRVAAIYYDPARAVFAVAGR